MKLNSFDMLAPFYDLVMGIFRRRIPAKIFRRLKPGEKDVILDLGGGTGYHSGRMVRHRQFLIVFDISFEMLKRARKYKHIHPVQGDAKNLPFKDKSFDIIMAVDSLHHIEDYSGVLKEVRRSGRNKFFAAEFHGMKPLGKIFTALERFLMSVSYKSPGDFRREALRYGITGDFEYVSSYEYFFTGSIH
ncbi:MAG: class I SAM-dependent methyltransferase [Deltaproteobacteria bacterium]|nr:class I SAM-dependent methyltransferase [Deltaproteobacteria bacterium]